VLGFSLLLNLFLAGMIPVGMIAGIMSRSEPKDLNTLLTAIEANMSAEDARAFDNAIRAEAQQYSEALQRVLQARRRVDEVLAAEPYSPAVMQTAIDAWRESWQTFVELFSHSFARALREISPAGRRRLARIAEPTLPRIVRPAADSP
jgi:uncharacterized membrane protein